MSSYEIWNLIIQAIIAVGAIIFGIWQILINKKLQRLQDYVSISVVPGSDGKIKVLNTGRINLYLWGFDMPSDLEGSYKPRFTKPRLIPTGAGESAYYWINPPNGLEKIQTIYDFDFKLYLTDEFDKKWISENGGRAEKIQIEKDGKKEDSVMSVIWASKTKKEKWKFD